MTQGSFAACNVSPMISAACWCEHPGCDVIAWTADAVAWAAVALACAPGTAACVREPVDDGSSDDCGGGGASSVTSSERLRAVTVSRKLLGKRQRGHSAEIAIDRTFLVNSAAISPLLEDGRGRYRLSSKEHRR